MMSITRLRVLWFVCFFSPKPGVMSPKIILDCTFHFFAIVKIRFRLTDSTFF